MLFFLCATWSVHWDISILAFISLFFAFNFPETVMLCYTYFLSYCCHVAFSLSLGCAHLLVSFCLFSQASQESVWLSLLVQDLPADVNPKLLVADVIVLLFDLGTVNEMFLAVSMVKMLEHRHPVELCVDYSNLFKDPKWTQKDSFSADCNVIKTTASPSLLSTTWAWY